jgi:D-alanine-D-alanine ligase-like ATP-grasp enzyme
MDLITVKTFNFPSEVTVVQSFLEMEGITVYLKNLTASQLAYSIGDIEMQVTEEDFERAKKALIDGGFAVPEDFY